MKKRKTLRSALPVLTAALIGASAILSNACAAEAMQGGNTETDTVTIIMGEPNFAVNGAYHELEEGLLTKALMKNDNVVSPLQDILATLGGTYAWDEAKQTATLSLNGNTLVLTLDNPKALVNGEVKAAPVAPQKIDGRIFLPVRFVMENLGCQVKWEQARTRVVITANVPVNDTKPQISKGGPITFATMLKQPKEWYGTAEAQQAADVILGFQNKDGGWIKLENDVDMTKPISGPGTLNVKVQSTIDNDATFSEMRFLAMVYEATKIEKYRDGFNRGLDYVLSGQYGNGGWPQFFPDGVGYQKRITFNDNAMVNILNVMRDVMNKEGEFSFVDDGRAAKAKAAYEKGIDLILKTQIVANGKKTAWCQQYDEETLEPASARAFELPSISSLESTGIVKFLMSIDNPGPEVKDAIQSAVAWLNEVKLSGVKVYTKIDPTLEFGFDRILVKDPKAPYLWARFYEIGTNKPIFASRDGIKKYDMADITYERRNKYSWYNNAPASLLTTAYPQWQQKWTPDENVLAE